MRRPRCACRQRVGDAAIDQMLAAAVAIERLQPAERRDRAVVVESVRAVSVGGGRGGIDQRHILRRAPAPEVHAEAIVVAGQKACIGFRRGRGGAQVKDRPHRTRVVGEIGWKGGRLDSGFEFAFGDGPAVSARTRPVADHQRALAPLFQGGHEVRADETRAARDDDHAAACHHPVSSGAAVIGLPRRHRQAPSGSHPSRAAGPERATARRAEWRVGKRTE